MQPEYSIYRLNTQKYCLNAKKTDKRSFIEKKVICL